MTTLVPMHPFVPPTFLNITAIWGENGVSVLQCWQILPGFNTSSQAGTAGASILQLGAVANMSYSVLPPGFNASFHRAPTEQYVPHSLPLYPLFNRADAAGKKVGRVPLGSRARHACQFDR